MQHIHLKNESHLAIALLQSWDAGLDLQKDTVIEIACLITDGRLRHPVEVLSIYHVAWHAVNQQ